MRFVISAFNDMIWSTAKSSAPFIFQIVKKVIAKQLKLCYNVLRVRCWAPSIMGCRQAVRHQTLTLAFVGSNPAIPANDPLAQLAEQLPCKQWVRSSNLRRITKKADALSGICFFAPEIRTISCNSPVDCCLRPAGRTQHHNVCRRQTCKRIAGRITLPPCPFRASAFLHRRFEPFFFSHKSQKAAFSSPDRTLECLKGQYWVLFFLTTYDIIWKRPENIYLRSVYLKNVPFYLRSVHHEPE